MYKLIKVLLWLSGTIGALVLGTYKLNRSQWDEKFLMGFEKYFRAMIGQEPLN